MDIKKEVKKLLDSDITGYRIYKETGVDQAVISKLRSGERKIEDLTVSTADKLLKFKGGKKMTRIYKDEDNNLVLSYKGIENSDYENISLDEFIEIVENSDMWDDFDSEIYESALDDVGLDYHNYDDPDKMWDDFLEAVRNG